MATGTKGILIPKLEGKQALRIRIPSDLKNKLLGDKIYKKLPTVAFDPCRILSLLSEVA